MADSLASHCVPSCQSVYESGFSEGTELRMNISLSNIRLSFCLSVFI